MTNDPRPTISQLWVYPIKSCAGVALHEAHLCETGLDLDRAWMVVDAHGNMLTQRDHPVMALIQPQLKTFEMVLRAPGMLALHIAIDSVEQPTQVRVWDDTVKAFDMGDVAAQWMSMAITGGKQALRLARFDPDHPRLSDTRWTQGVDAPNQFADGFPILVCTDSSIDGLNQRLVANAQAEVGINRFRPNIVLSGLGAHDEDLIDTMAIGDDVALKLVKPCTRCSMPDVNPATGEAGSSVGAALAAYRSDARMAGQITFGMNAIILRGHDAVVRIGQSVDVDYGV